MAYDLTYRHPRCVGPTQAGAIRPLSPHDSCPEMTLKYGAIQASEVPIVMQAILSRLQYQVGVNEQAARGANSEAIAVGIS